MASLVVAGKTSRGSGPELRGSSKAAASDFIRFPIAVRPSSEKVAVYPQSGCRKVPLDICCFVQISAFSLKQKH